MIEPRQIARAILQSALPRTRRRRLTAVFLAAIFVGYPMLVASPAQAHGGWQVRVGWSQKCLDVASGSHANGARIIQWPCADGKEMQKFHAERMGFTQYNEQIIRFRAHHSGKCIDAIYTAATDWGRMNGTKIQQYDCHGGWNQQWIEKPSAQYGRWHLINRNSGKCLDVPGSYYWTNGIQLQQWDCLWGEPQKFAYHFSQY